VLWRQVSLGADSEGGCRFVQRMLTIAGIARKRGINLLDWLVRAPQARIEFLTWVGGIREKIPEDEATHAWLPWTARRSVPP
jgi:hypothetical protein